MKSTTISILFATCLPSVISAASISLTNIGANGISDALIITRANSSTPASGGIAAAGYFGTLSDAQVLTLSADLGNIATLIADFQVVTSTTLDSVVAGGGLFNLDNGSVVLPNATRAGSGLYSFLGNGSNLLSSTAWILWDNIAIVDAEDSVASPDSNTLLMAQEGVALISGGLTTAVVDFSAIGGAANTQTPGIRLAAVPEPSAFIISALGVLGLLRRKR